MILNRSGNKMKINTNLDHTAKFGLGKKKGKTKREVIVKTKNERRQMWN